MNRVRKGKILIIIMIAVILLMDVATIITTSMLYSGMGRADLSRQSMLTGAFRLIFTGLLLYLLYRGNTIVKGILIFLFIIAGIISGISFLATANIFTLLIGVIDISFVILLLVSKNIKLFFMSQRNEDISPEQL